MSNPSLLVSAGPCLIMAMGAFALAVVNIGLSRAHHALIWAAANALAALEWGLLAWQGGPPSGAIAGVLIRLSGVGAALLLVAGLFVRCGQPAGRVWRAATVGALACTILAGFLPAAELRAATVYILSLPMMVWAARLVVLEAKPPSPTEGVLVAVLLATALVDGLVAALALAEYGGVLPARHAFVAVTLVSANPASAAMALALIMLIAHDFAVELRRLLHTDPLTGVLNREGFDQAARALVERGRPRRLALAMVDLDHFKKINDVHGHAVGDATLTGVAKHLAERIGRDGMVARIGGEEFALLLPGLDAHAALRRVEVLRQGLEAAAAEARSLPRVTASFGVAERAPGEPIAQLVERADAALYRAKRGGRNRATLAEAPST